MKRYDVEAELQSRGIEYREDEKRFLVNCPFHDDENPSCGVWKESGYFQCFSGSCGESGSFVEFIAEVDGISVGDAARKLKSEDDIPDIEKWVWEKLQRDRDEDELRYYSTKSFGDTFPPVRRGSKEYQYLIGRGITEESIRRFRMRVGTGLYSSRVVLPIFTVEGKLLAYVGRSIKEKPAVKTKKSRSPHRTLYGLYELVRDWDHSGVFPYVVVVEGEFDAIYLQQFGVPAVSNMGTMPMTSAKVFLLKRYAKKVVLCYDEDEAGYVGVFGNRGLDKVRTIKPGELETLSGILWMTTIRLPDGKDPNELSPEEVDRVFDSWRF